MSNIGCGSMSTPTIDYTIQIGEVKVDLRDIVKMGERITELEEIVTKLNF